MAAEHEVRVQKDRSMELQKEMIANHFGAFSKRSKWFAIISFCSSIDRSF